MSNLEFSVPPEWAWLRSVSMAERVADCLTYRTDFPKPFSVPNMDRVSEDEPLQPFVSFRSVRLYEEWITLSTG